MTTGNPPEGPTVTSALDPAEPGITQYLHTGAEAPLLAARHDEGEPMNFDDHDREPGDMRAYPWDPAYFGWNLAECQHSKDDEMFWDLADVLDYPGRGWPGGPWADDEDLRRRR
ncbi:MAG TPA: hypothetical protein VE733_23645 [Streptosporangiaceae bacterium]|jgi:hypothetical protein|nr:hypothetical protein [Streptosporangiaceae bacterium]